MLLGRNTPDNKVAIEGELLKLRETLEMIKQQEHMLIERLHDDDDVVVVPEVALVEKPLPLEEHEE